MALALTQVEANEYGTEPRAAVAAFRSDLELMASNAMAFHRPNERWHALARRILK